MKQIRNMLSEIVVAGIFLAFVPSMSWAESASRTGDAADFLAGTTCPPPDGAPCFDPTAGGQKVTGTLAVVYDKTVSVDCRTPFVRNMYVSLTLEQGNLRVPFTTDYLNGPPSHPSGFCMLTSTQEQVAVILALVRNRVIPFFFSCDPGPEGTCPSFRIKSVTNFQYTTGNPLLPPNPNSGGFSADITIAVQ